MISFISKDSVEGNITNPLSLNLYTYCYNNPIIFTDPSGNVVVKDDNQYKYLTNLASGTGGIAIWARHQLSKQLYYHDTVHPSVYFNSKVAYDATHGEPVDPVVTFATDTIAGFGAGGIFKGIASRGISSATNTLTKTLGNKGYTINLQLFAEKYIFPKSNSDMKKIFGIGDKVFHKEIKPEIIKQLRNSSEYGNDMKMMGKNPDIGVNASGKIVIKNVINGETLLTDIPFDSFLP